MHHRLAIGRSRLAGAAAVTLITVTIGLLVPFRLVSPAKAATPIVCNRAGGAPASKAVNRNIRYFYSLRCNTLNGVFGIQHDLVLHNVDTDGTVDGSSRTLRQTGVDFSKDYDPRGVHARYQPEMIVTIYTDQPFGKVPGCHRYAEVEVKCHFFGAVKYY